MIVYRPTQAKLNTTNPNVFITHSLVMYTWVFDFLQV